MSKKVSYARLQTGVYAVGAGDLGTVLPPQSKVLEGLSMELHDHGLLVSFVYRAANKSILIPYANVSLMELAVEEKAPKGSK